MTYDIIIIGAGASGLAAAIAAKRANRRLNVAAVEALPRVGKKLLATGNGRCNITNENPAEGRYGNFRFASAALNEYTPEKVIEFFRSIGILCVPDSEGRMYPAGNNANSVLDALRYEAQRLGVELICENHVDKAEKRNGIFILGELKAKKIILCTGGCAAPAQGSDGSGYKLLKAFGHSVTAVYPGLVQLTVEENTKSLKGVRAKAEAELFCDGKCIDEAKGEVQFTDYGLSGIAVMDLSRSVKKGNYRCRINTIPTFSREEVKSFLLPLDREMPIENALSGLMPKALGRYILKKVDINALTPLGRLGDGEIANIIVGAQWLDFTVTGTKGFKNAQITVGGADVGEFNPNTMESKLVKGLYCAGELLDVDGRCGGFNLQWAWASGLLAGRCAATER